MDTRKIEVFKTVAMLGSVTKAAERLHTAQPALSRTIKQIEEEMGAPLFDRVGRTIQLNTNGQTFLRYADRAQRCLDTAKREIGQRVEDQNRTVRIAVRTALGRPGHAAGMFRRRYPEIFLSCVYSENNEWEHDLEVFTTPASIDGPNTFLMGIEDFVAVVPLDHPLAGRESIRLRELENDTFIVSASSELRSMIDEMFSVTGIAPVIGSELQAYFDVLSFVREGLGCCIAPRKTWLTGGITGVAVLPIDGLPRTRNIYLRWPADRIPTREMVLFRDFLKDYFA